MTDFAVHGSNNSLYEGATITEKQSLLLIMSFVQKHHLTNEALDDFLTLMNMHFPNVVPCSKYLFFKKFHLAKFQRHYFCETCTSYFGLESTCQADAECSCVPPNSITVAKDNHWYFSYWKLESQLKLLLEDDNISKYVINRPESSSSSLKDVGDGKIHNNLQEFYGYGSNDISLVWNVDGVPIFR